MIAYCTALLLLLQLHSSFTRTPRTNDTTLLSNLINCPLSFVRLTYDSRRRRTRMSWAVSTDWLPEQRTATEKNTNESILGVGEWLAVLSLSRTGRQPTEAAVDYYYPTAISKHGTWCGWWKLWKIMQMLRTFQQRDRNRIETTTKPWANRTRPKSSLENQKIIWEFVAAFPPWMDWHGWKISECTAADGNFHSHVL